MQHKRVKFIPPNKPRVNFQMVLRKRVEAYFKENNISKYGDFRMIFKTIAMLSMYFVPYALIMTNSFSNGQMLLMTAIMGVGLAGIGLSVMHDANHGAYSDNKLVNTIMGFSLNIVGGCAMTWKVQHNVLHHSYTNIPGYDEDIRDRKVVRLSPDVRHRGIHRFQHIYALFLYGFPSLTWVIYKDIFQLIDYAKRGLIQNVKKEVFILVVSKLFYYAYIIVLPLMVLDVTFLQFLAGFLLMHYVAGMILTVIFQLAHVLEETVMPLPTENDTIENQWAIHQMETTANFATHNRLLNWYAGGLNFQVEHHLFPQVCHIHYPAISKIVRETAEEHGVPYYNNKTFWKALGSHLRFLKRLGDPNIDEATLRTATLADYQS
ncbi:MAG: acyl-CoA desaturase [Bacteroidetes bacterium]|nr:acyl-CoA desaturase [Bacteroidota bacterium]